MTQEFHISVTPIGGDEYLIRTERVAPGVPLAEEQVIWPVEEWLNRASGLMHDPLLGVLRGHSTEPLLDAMGQSLLMAPDVEAQRSNSLVLLGQQLYNALFQGTIRDSWVMAQGIAQHRQEVLRLRLGLKDHRLPRLPWEVLYTGDRPIATGTDVVFSRYHSSFAALSPSLQFQQLPLVEPGQPLKILMVLAAPTDQDVLALKQEALHLQEELQGMGRAANATNRFSDIQLTILEQPGREQLTQALEHNHYQVLHYAGHSNLGAAGGSLYLVSNKTGLTETLSGDDLAGLLVNNGIRMAVFNSCRGVYTATSEASPDGTDGNLAEALVKRGIPAVLAMAERIPDDVALNLSRLFYRNLKQFLPVDLSLNRARQGLLSSYGSRQLYWALPILYLQPEFDGHLVAGGDDMEDVGNMLRDTRRDSIPNRAVVKSGRETTSPLVGVSLTEGLMAVDTLDLAADLATVGTLSAFDEDVLDPEELEAELEFEDLDEQPERVTVAQLVQQLSQTGGAQTQELSPEVGDALPPAATSRLPLTHAPVEGENAIVVPPVNPTTFPEIAQSTRTSLLTEATTHDPVPDLEDGSVYLELEQLLAETGKLTAAIAACNQAIQQNPANPEAYDALGLALYQQGYLPEAIVAFQQAIQINPALAEAHNHLGLALYQQGNIRDAIRAYSRAVQLAPHLISARQNLEIALNRQGVQLPASQSVLTGTSPRTSVATATSPSAAAGSGYSAGRHSVDRLASLPLPTVPHARKTPASHWLSVLWWGAGTAAVITLTYGAWFYRMPLAQFLPSLPTLEQPAAPAKLEDLNDLRQAKTSAVTAFATEKLGQGNMAAARTAIAVLLDRQALSEAAVILTAATQKVSTDDPELNFLMGRLAWQQAAAHNFVYSYQDARRAWERASKQQAKPTYWNALGFAYYTEGELDRAREAWLKALQLTEQAPTITVSSTSKPASQEKLTAYAGLSLLLMKRANNQIPSEQNRLRSEAIELRHRILNDAPMEFQPEALAQNWMWSEQAIQDWQKLLTLQ